MKAKLIKVNDNQIDGGFYILRDLNGNPIALEGNLSLKNCQAIERGFDLDELAMKWFEDLGHSIYNHYNTMPSFKAGFQKALELMGDKKFSEEDLMEAYSRGQTNSPIQSLQQTEWDVEIEMERSKFIADKSLRNDIKNGFNYTPKLDADGCLILKRINL